MEGLKGIMDLCREEKFSFMSFFGMDRGLEIGKRSSLSL